MDTQWISAVAVVALLAGIFFVKSKKKDKGKDPSAPVTPSTGTPVTPSTGTPVTPSTGTPVTPSTGTPDTGQGEVVLLDRNRKKPGDAGYDPRAVRPYPEFSPIEPQGTFYGEGKFNPNARYIDLHGRFHNAG